MNFSIKNQFSAGILGAVVSATLALGGCSSTSNSDDGGDASSDLAGDTGPTLYGLTTGDSCFDIVSVATTAATDGCNIGVADTVQNMGLVGAALLVNYDMATATLSIGTAGSLGAGTIAFNMGTLTRAGNPTDPQMTTCSWHQTDNAQVTLTATNEFNISATEVQNMFATACSPIPSGGTCTSTWTWHMVKGTKTPPACN
jgi:hypothetical protein